MTDHADDISFIPPPVIEGPATLPFLSITADRFEELVRVLITRKSTVVDAHRYGVQGQAQFGIDVYARNADGSLTTYQCRRYQRMTAADVKRCVDDFTAGPWYAVSSHFELWTSADLRHARLDEELRRQLAVLGQDGKTFQWQDREVLTASLLPHPDIIGRFFGAAWATAVTGRHAGSESHEFVSGRVRDYLLAVVGNTDLLRFGEPTAPGGRVVPSPRRPGRIHLRDVWTSLAVALPSSGGEPNVETRVPVLDVLAGDPYVSAVLLGDPGSGKSTVVAFLAMERARSCLASSPHSARIPVHVRLGELTPSSAPVLADLWTGVREVRYAQGDPAINGDLVQEIQDWLMGSEGALLFDGLDEVPDALVPAVLRIIDLARNTYKGSFLVTCRTYDYLLPNPNRRIAFPTLRLLPLEREQMSEYVTRWYEAYGAATGENLTEVGTQLVDSIARSPGLLELCRSPLLLSLLTAIHARHGQLPPHRALLYKESVQCLLAHPAEWRSDTGPTDRQADTLMSLAARVASVYHASQEANDGEFPGLTKRDLYNIVSDELGVLGSELRIGSDEWRTLNHDRDELLERLVQSNGLLVEQGGGYHDFPHRSFREFLAGLYFAGGGKLHLAAVAAACRPHWREAFRLMAGFTARAPGGNLYYLLTLIADLADTDRVTPAPFKASDSVMAGEMLAEVGDDALRGAGFDRVCSRSSRRHGIDGLRPRVVSELWAIVESVPPVLNRGERIRAATLLGRMGDPRFLDEGGHVTAFTTRAADLAAGRFTVGRALETQFAKSDEAPQRELDFHRFRIGRYTVSNLEYLEFVAAGGYDDERWWETHEAQRWRQKEEDFITDLEIAWVQTFHQHHQPELDRGIYQAELVETYARSICRRHAPDYWDDRRFNGPNQPVVGINWWEARAFCAWLTGRGHEEGWLTESEEVRLPTEWEWERATKPQNDDRLFPWGDALDSERVHAQNDGLALEQATPLGCFPHGTWPGGPFDLAGNVWEWTLSRKVPYDPAYDGERELTSGLGERTVRGGSWQYPLEAGLTTARQVDSPSNAYRDVGFRWVIHDLQHGPVAYRLL